MGVLLCGFDFFLLHFRGRIKIGGRRRIPGRPCAIMIRNMEDGAARALFPVALLAGLLLICGAASAQLVLGQYADEASLGTAGGVTSSGNLAAGVLGLDCGGLAFRSGKWALGVAVAVPESYGRPKIVVGSSDGVWSDRLTLDQTGYLRIFYAGIARRLPAGLSLGLGINYTTGTLARTIIEKTSDPQRLGTITAD